MKKQAKSKVKSSARSARGTMAEPELPGLVAAMAKLVERLEGLERKMDQVLGRVSHLPSDIRNAVQHLQPLNAPQHVQLAYPAQALQRPDHGPAARGHQHDSRRERIMYKAVCADCRKDCEVPFKPTEERPVYCKECFAARKSGAFQPQKTTGFVPGPMNYSPQGIAKASGGVAVLKGGKQKAARHGGAKLKKQK